MKNRMKQQNRNGIRRRKKLALALASVMILTGTYSGTYLSLAGEAVMEADETSLPEDTAALENASALYAAEPEDVSAAEDGGQSKQDTGAVLEEVLSEEDASGGSGYTGEGSDGQKSVTEDQEKDSDGLENQANSQDNQADGLDDPENQTEDPGDLENQADGLEILEVLEIEDAEPELELLAQQPTSIDINYGMFRTSVEVAQGQSAELKIVATAKEGATLTYQWYQYVTTAESAAWAAVEGATSDSLTVANVQGAMSFKCVVTTSVPATDGSNSRTKEVTYSVNVGYVDSGLIVNGEAVTEDNEVSQEKTVRVLPGAPAELTAQVRTNSELGLKYSWSLIQYDSSTKKDVEIPVGNGASYTIASVTQEQEVRLVVDDGYHTAQVTFTVIPDERMNSITDLVQGTSNTAVITTAGERVLFRIVPTKTAMYVLYSATDQDTCANLYDANWEKLFNDDDSGEKNNFGIKYPMLQGETYYLEVWYYNVKSEDVGSFSVMMQEAASSEIKEVERQDATCVENGYVIYYTGTYYVKSGNSSTEKNTVRQILPLDPNAHSYGDDTVVKEATALETGSQIHTCSLCGHTETEEIAKLEPTITLNAKKLTLQVKQSTKALEVSGLAKGDYVKSYTSSNKKIVTVGPKGKITAKNKTGSATITITLASGLQKTVKVTVQQNPVKTKKITGIPEGVILKKGQKLALEPKITPITTKEKVTYTSSDKTIASVSKKGVVKAKKKGLVLITVKCGSVIREMVVKVTKK